MASSLRSGGVCEWFDAAHGGCICLSCFDVSAATDTTVIIIWLSCKRHMPRLLSRLGLDCSNPRSA